jgi:hypothetical protein
MIACCSHIFRLNIQPRVRLDPDNRSKLSVAMLIGLDTINDIVVSRKNL